MAAPSNPILQQWDQSASILSRFAKKNPEKYSETEKVTLTFEEEEMWRKDPILSKMKPDIVLGYDFTYAFFQTIQILLDASVKAGPWEFGSPEKNVDAYQNHFFKVRLGSTGSRIVVISRQTNKYRELACEKPSSDRLWCTDGILSSRGILKATWATAEESRKQVWIWNDPSQTKLQKPKFSMVDFYRDETADWGYVEAQGRNVWQRAPVEPTLKMARDFIVFIQEVDQEAQNCFEALDLMAPIPPLKALVMEYVGTPLSPSLRLLPPITPTPAPTPSSSPPPAEPTK